MTMLLSYYLTLTPWNSGSGNIMCSHHTCTCKM